jgi:sulfur carrier protein ThiS adenylyltransferase
MKTLKEDLIEKLGADNYKLIREAKIGIAGAGGLGSNCAASLARTGFRKITIVDFDTVSSSNLDRQFYFLDQVGMDKVEALRINLLRINPDLELNMIKKRIETPDVADIFSGCDIVAECLDSAECKSMLTAELMRIGKFVVAISGLGGVGKSDDIKIHRVKERLVMIGDLKSDICGSPALAPRVNIAAAKQADVILEYVIKKR